MVMTSAGWAASVQPGQGTLTLNQGQGFQPVNNRIDANVGDAVMVSPDGTATVTYEDGCIVNVQPGSVTTIAPISPCASGSYADDSNLTDTLLKDGVTAGAIGTIIAAIIDMTTGKAASP